jgi:hypothetical protein
MCKLQYPGLNLWQIDISETVKEKKLMTTTGECKMKFDVMLGNPPYQAPQTIRNDKGLTGGGTTLWNRFLTMSIEDIVKDGGYVCMVHPSGWRQPTNKLWALMREKQIEYLEIHSDKDGKRVFGADTRYDWEIIHNAPVTKSTVIKDENGIEISVAINKLPFIPNFAFDILDKIVAKNGDPTCELAYSRSAYGTDKSNMRDTQNGQFQHSCVYMISIKRGPTFWYSNTRNNGHFGVPKVIFASGRSTGYILDTNGEYGLTQFARAIVDDAKNLPSIYKALTSEKFAAFGKSLHIAQTEMNKDCFQYFRKDFWKEFK